MKTLKHEVKSDREVWLKQYNNGTYVIVMACSLGMLASQVYKSWYYANLSFITFKNYPLQTIQKRYAY